jgi:hypothetical protein
MDANKGKIKVGFGRDNQTLLFRKARRVQSQEVGCRDTARCRIVPDAPESGASAPSAAPAATWQFIARRRRKPAAIDAPALKRRTTDGTEVPYSGAPAVRESGAVLPTNILGLHPSQACTPDHPTLNFPFYSRLFAFIRGCRFGRLTVRQLVGFTWV